MWGEEKFLSLFFVYHPTTMTSNDNNTFHHLYSRSCGYCTSGHDEPLFMLDDNGLTLVNGAWLEKIPKHHGDIENDEPFPYNYLVSLFTAPDMAKHLAEATITEDVYALPIHLQRLISEAKEEVVIERIRSKEEQQQEQHHPALSRLERVRQYVWMRSSGDVASLMTALVELLSDEDELENVLGI